MAFLDELEQFGDRVHVVPEDESGRLDLAAILGEPRTGHPRLLLRARAAAGRRRGALRRLAGRSLHLERFSAQADRGAGRGELLRAGPAALRQDAGRCPPDRSVFDVVREAGVSVLGSCLEGICGTCETEVVDGDVDHRDSILDDEERASNEVMMICVSRCRSARLVLDL